ncbi:hypothetical protein CMO96_00390 [Candidatus Woesebacteria bacterium]|nr:hypothetical protein [Candidatus Woesebacteria bacterium]|tara:strand:- start:388 stop:702 length:315 start_codon:yes stop_codon:yes gene_type:complete
MSSDKQRGNRENLIPFKKGQSGNPKGRPKKENCISDLLKCKGEEIQADGRTRLQTIADKLYDKAQGGDLRAMEMIFDRLEGKPIQATITSFEELPDGFDIVDIG